MIVPPQGRDIVLRDLHEAHPGITRMKGLARSYVWWPLIETDVENLVKSCVECLENQKTPEKASIHPWEMPNKPWSRIHVDYAGPIDGKMILVMVDSYSKWIDSYSKWIDSYSKWIDAEVVSGSTAQITIASLCRVFSCV